MQQRRRVPTWGQWKWAFKKLCVASQGTAESIYETDRVVVKNYALDAKTGGAAREVESELSATVQRLGPQNTGLREAVFKQAWLARAD